MSLIPSISISNVKGYKIVSRKSNSYHLLVWEGWDSPIEDGKIQIHGFQFEKSNEAIGVFEIVQGDGSTVQWQVWAPSPCLFMDDADKPKFGVVGNAWTGYAETGHRMEEKDLERYYRADCHAVREKRREVRVNLDGVAVLDKEATYTAGWNPLTEKEIIAEIEKRSTEQSKKDFGTFRAFDYEWDGKTKTVYLFNRPGQSPIVFNSEDEMLRAAEVVAKPQIDAINEGLRNLEESIRNGGDGKEVGLSSWGGAGTGKTNYSLRTSLGTSGEMMVHWHRGEVSEVKKYGWVDFIWGKHHASLAA